MTSASVPKTLLMFTETRGVLRPRFSMAARIYTPSGTIVDSPFASQRFLIQLLRLSTTNCGEVALYPHRLEQQDCNDRRRPVCDFVGMIDVHMEALGTPSLWQR